MSTEIAVSPIKDLETMAKKVAASGLFKMNETQAFTLMLLCQSRGLHPIEAVMRFDIIQGRPAMKAEAMLAEFQAIGGSVEWTTESDDCTKQEAIFSHPKLCPKPKKVRFTIEDAERAKLKEKDIWRGYPAPLMRARVISSGIRMLAPGIVSGIYTPEEVSDFDARETPIQATATVAPAVEPSPAVAEAVAEVEAMFDRQAAPQNGERWSDKEKRLAAEGKPVKVPVPADLTDAAGRPLAKGEQRTWAGDLNALILATNQEWEALCKSHGEKYRPIASLGVLVRFLLDWLVSSERIGPDRLLTNGREDRTKQHKFLAAWHKKYPEEFIDLARQSLADLMSEAIESNGFHLDTAEDGVQGPAEAALVED